MTMTAKRARTLPRPTRRAHAIAGFTLIELLVGAGILLASLAALVGAFLSISMASTLTQHQTQAINDANLAMEELRNLEAKKSLKSLVGPTDWTLWLSGIKGANALLPNETVEITPTDVPASDPAFAAKFSRIEVKVSWDDRGGKPSVSLVSLFEQL